MSELLSMPSVNFSQNPCDILHRRTHQQELQVNLALVPPHVSKTRTLEASLEGDLQR